MVLKTIVIPGNPIPLKRPRFSTRNGKAYNSQNDLMDSLSFLVKQQFDEFKMLTGPVQLNIRFFMGIPKSMTKKKKDSLNSKYHVKKPDLDNNLKLIFDVFTRASIFKDDSQVAVINSQKIYSDEPRTEIDIIRLENK